MREVQRAHPGRFALVKPVDPDDPAVAEFIADWKKNAGTVGIRIMMTKEAGRDPERPGPRPKPARSGRYDFRSTCCAGATWTRAALIDRHPDTRFIIDHLAIMQPRNAARPPQPWPIAKCWTSPGAERVIKVSRA